MRRLCILAVLITCGTCAVALGDLLVNEQFANPADFPPCGGVGGNGDPPASDWTLTGNAHWNRNTAFGGPADCATEVDDGYYASFWWGYMNVNESTVTQNKSGLTIGEYYKLSFKWSNLANMSDSAVGGTFSVEVRDGLNNTSGTAKASISEDIIAAAHPFETHSFVFQATSGDITVCWRVKPKTTPGHTNSYAFFLISHMDFIKLEVAPCTTPPTIDPTTPTAPAYGVRGQSPSITINGTNFVDGTTAQLISGATVIDGTGVTVAPDGLSLTATFAIAADAPVGLYTVKVARPEAYCDPATASGGFEVVLPGLSNGNFNGDASSIAECTPGTLTPNLPKDWQASEAGTWGYDGRLNLNGYRPTPIDTLPTCPVPGADGYYGTIASTSNNPGAQAQAWQSFPVTAGQTYVVSGKFAGSGDCTVTLRLLDGLRRNGTELASKVVRDTAGFFDWTTDFVTAEAPVGGTGVMTFVWEVARNSGNDNASHADKFELTVCSSPIDVTGVTPSLGLNNGILSITDLAGTGFSDAAGTPTVLLAKVGGGTTITASNVVVVSGTQITCDFDLTGAASGRYDLTVFQDGCIDTLPSSVMVVGESFINGSFELPENTQDPCTGQIGGLPTGWSTDAPSGLNRDGQAPPPNPCPSSDGGHYGSMSEGSAATVRAWQTVQVIGGNYKFSGLFNVPVGVTVTLRLLDGDESGTQLAESSVPVEVNTWTEGSVSANAPTSGIMTVVWEMQLTGTEPAVGGSADGLKFESTCNNPVFDFDGDGDVDQADFAAFQVCYTGATGTLVAGCECADSNGDNLVTQSDATDFEACASGPGIPANPDCD